MSFHDRILSKRVNEIWKLLVLYGASVININNTDEEIKRKLHVFSYSHLSLPSICKNNKVTTQLPSALHFCRMEPSVDLPWPFPPVDPINHRLQVKAHSVVAAPAFSSLEYVAGDFRRHRVLRPIVDRRNSRCPCKAAHCKVQRGDSRSLRSRTSRPSKL